MEMYQFCLCGLGLANISALISIWRARSQSNAISEESQTCKLHAHEISSLRRHFMIVYVLVSIADWLQGSFFYAVYRDGHGLPESSIGKLFAVGFATGAWAALFIGNLAERYGRKRACIAYCVLYALACLSVLLHDYRILVLGRALGGLATTLSFSAFEPWLLGYLERICGCPKSRNGAAKEMFALMATMTGLISTASGVFSGFLVSWSGSVMAPFVASAAILFIAAIYVLAFWTENYGDQVTSDVENLGDSHATFWQIWGPSFRHLSLISFTFEGSIYTMCYFWPAAITAARARTTGLSSTPILGLVFANLMAAMMLGSNIFQILTLRTNRTANVRPFQFVLLIAALSLLSTICSNSEVVCFGGLCLFEACVGVYTPMVSLFKAQVVPDKHRSRAYGLLRAPTNVFVVMALSFVQAGSTYRNVCLGLSSFLLFSASLATTFHKPEERPKLNNWSV